MARFEVGKMYGAWDAAVPPVKVIKRTAKMCLVEDTELGNQWRMMIKSYDGSEEMTDTSVPEGWRECYTYSTRFEQK